LFFGVTATAVSVAYRLKSAHAVRDELHKLEADQLNQGSFGLAAAPGHSTASLEAQRDAQQYQWELTRTHRTKVGAMLTIMSIVVQGACGFALLACSTCRVSAILLLHAAGLPMSIVNILLVFVENSKDKSVR
jgi:hypothetical protein